MQRLPLVFRGLVVAEGRFLAGRSGLRKHQRQRRHPLAVAAGVGTLGVDRPGEQLNECVEQLLLFGLQALTFDTHGSRAGYCLEEGDAIGFKLFQVTLIAAVGQQQDQQPHGFVMAIVQADADQVRPGSVHFPQYTLQVARLFEAKAGDHIVGTRQLLQP
ncbi:hypothetical protein D3C73_802420 [compost metagenome]